MPDIDADIDALYQGPLEAFTDARNALAKSAKRADIKTLVRSRACRPGPSTSCSGIAGR